MRVLVTGAAGFVGSHLTDALAARGDDVLALDSFTDAYSPAMKRRNVAAFDDGVELLEADLRDADLMDVLDGVELVFHQAAIPGVRASWSDVFGGYVSSNVVATQRLLEAVRATPGVRRLVYASSSSVYGNALTYPTRESDMPRPSSPYGVTKLAAEHLCLAYAANFGLPTVALRYFSVFGPRQRPDMGVYRICEAALGQGVFTVFGSGAQIRDLTFVSDVVAANLSAAGADVPPGTVVNVAGGSEVELNSIIDLVGEFAGADVPIRRAAEQPGDVFRTGGDTTAASELLGWEPQTSLADGIAAQYRWHVEQAESASRRVPSAP